MTVDELRERIAEQIHVAHQSRIGYGWHYPPWTAASATYQAGVRADADRILAAVADLFTEDTERALGRAVADTDRLAKFPPTGWRMDHADEVEMWEGEAAALRTLADTIAALRRLSVPQPPKQGS